MTPVARKPNSHFDEPRKRVTHLNDAFQISVQSIDMCENLFQRLQ